MVDWCPKCGAMLPPDLEKCQKCGKRLGKRRGNGPGSEYSTRDIFWLSAYMVGVALVPMILVILVAVVCILSGNR